MAITLADILNQMGNKVKLSNTMISADKVNEWWKITMGCDGGTIIDLLNGEVTPLLIICNTKMLKEAQEALKNKAGV